MFSSLTALKFEIPKGLPSLLHRLSKEVIRHQPENIYQFCAKFLEEELYMRDGKEEVKVIPEFICAEVCDQPKDEQGTCGKYAAKQSISGKNEGEAATKIQAGFRGYKTRKEMKLVYRNSTEEPGKKMKSPPLATIKEEEEAATKIQAGIRGFLTRKRIKQHSLDLGHSQSIDILEADDAGNEMQQHICMLQNQSLPIQEQIEQIEESVLGKDGAETIEEQKLNSAIDNESILTQLAGEETSEVVEFNSEVEDVNAEVLDIKSEVAEVKSEVNPEVIEVKSEVAEVIPQIVEIKSDVVEVKPEFAEVKLEAVDVKPEFADVKLEAVDVKSEVADVKPEAADVKSEVKSVVVEVKPEVADVTSEVKSEVAEVNADVVSPESLNTEIQDTFLTTGMLNMVDTVIIEAEPVDLTEATQPDLDVGLKEASQLLDIFKPESAEFVQEQILDVPNSPVKQDGAEQENLNQPESQEVTQAIPLPSADSAPDGTVTAAHDTIVTSVPHSILSIALGTQASTGDTKLGDQPQSPSVSTPPTVQYEVHDPISAIASTILQRAASTEENVLENGTKMVQNGASNDLSPQQGLCSDTDDEVKIPKLEVVEEEDAGSVVHSPEPITALEISQSLLSHTALQKSGVPLDNLEGQVTTQASTNADAVPEPVAVPEPATVPESTEKPEAVTVEVRAKDEAPVEKPLNDAKPLAPSDEVPVQRRSAKRKTAGADKYRSGVVLDNFFVPEPSGNTHEIHKLEELDAEIESDAMMLNNAASKIQAGFRGYQVRKGLNNAATKIQSNYRGYKARKYLRNQANAATKIQATVRGYLARKKVPKSKLQTEQRRKDAAARRRSSSSIHAATLAATKTRQHSE